MGNKKKIFINTMGCQMNVYDTEQILRALANIGYKPTATPEAADLIIANTCTIREKAEQKAFSFLGRTAELKRKNPRLIVAIGGCVAQQEGSAILQRMPYIDIIFGTDAISRLPDLVRRMEKKQGRVIDVQMENGLNEIKGFPLEINPDETAKFVTIMRGCDNFCTYCVVPYVRGRERSRAPENIIEEIRDLSTSGVLEVTLLGQNVNSYGKKEGLCSFAELIRKVNDIDGIKRIRFTTSHPKDLLPDLMAAFGSVEKLCNHIHLPVQSGSNAVLKRMNRKYSREEYLTRVEKLRKFQPDIAISSDIIVGFPGESKNDYRQTLDLIKNVGYDSLFVFNYSDRPNAPSTAFPDKVPEEEKNERLKEILEFQGQVTTQKNKEQVGKTLEILVEGQSKKYRSDTSCDEKTRIQWSGRTSTNKVVNFYLNDDDPIEAPFGKLLHVKIEKALAHSLWGRGVRNPDLPDDGKEKRS